MLKKEDFIKSVYEKSKTISTEDEFYNTEVYKSNKEHKYIYYKIVVNFIFVFALLGTVGVIAVTTYRTLNNKPNYNWLDGSVKFNEKYDEYSKPIGETVGVHNDTELKLVSQNYDGGFAVLEFYLKLNEEDKEYLKLGENTYTSEEIEEQRKSFNDFADERINSYDPSLTEEENRQISERWKNNKINYEKQLEEMSLEKNTVKLLLNNEEVARYNYKIDDKKYSLWDCEKQEVEKISDLEYKIYMIYFIPDECVENKDNFTMGFENIKLVASKDVSRDTTEKQLNNGIELSGNFTVNLEKNDSEVKMLKINEDIIQYNILTENIEYVKITPMQTIIKIKARMDDLREHSLSCSAWYPNVPDYIGDIDFNVYNESDEMIGCTNVESKRSFWYENGDYEEWPTHWLVSNDEDRSTDGGDLEMIRYVIVSNDDYNGHLKVCPTISRINEKGQIYFKEIDNFFEIEFN